MQGCSVILDSYAVGKSSKAYYYIDRVLKNGENFGYEAYSLYIDGEYRDESPIGIQKYDFPVQMRRT